jgi:hypothetical protein
MCPSSQETEFDTTERTAGMDRAPKSALRVFAFLVVAAGIVKATAGPAFLALTGVSPEMIAQLVTPLVAEAVPREFEGQKDWGKTTPITTGLHSDGNFFKFDIHREKSEVNDGVWKKYRVTLVDPDKNLEIRIDNVQRQDDGKYKLALFVAAKVHAWAKVIVYKKGLRVLSLEPEGDTSVRLWVDADVGVETVKSSTFIPGVELQPVVTDARLKFDDFRLTRIGDVHGDIAKELGVLLRKVLQKELSGPKLVDRLNHSLQKHPERLRLSPDQLLGKSTPKKKKDALDSPKP